MTLPQKLSILCCLFLAGSVSAQIKVFNGGYVTLGSSGGTLYPAKVQAAGNTLFSTVTSGSGFPSSAAYIRSLASWSTDSTVDYTWYNDDRTGIFHPASGIIAISIVQSEKFRFNTDGQILSGRTSSLAAVPEYSWKSDPNTGIYRPGTDVLGFVTNGTERMRITSGGLVGIETTSPSSTLSVGGSGNSLYKGYFNNSSTSDGATAGYFAVATPTGLTNKSYAVQGIVTCGGGLAYGLYGSSFNATAQSLGKAIGVYGQGGNATGSYNYGVAGVLLGSNNGAGVFGSDHTNAGLMACPDNYAGYFGGKLRTTDDSPVKPTAGSWTGISDMRLKTDTASFKDGLDVVRKIKPVTYKFKDMGGLPADKTFIGVIAQEIQKVAPYCVGTAKLIVKQSEAAEFEQSEPIETESGEAQSIVTTLSYNYDALIYVLINSVKQLDATIAAMKDGSVKQPAATERGQQLQQQLDELKELVNACCTQKNSSLSSATVVAGNADGNWLAQNKPNPFNRETVIDYNVVKEGKASILVFDMSGKLLKTIPVKIPGRGSVTINANDFQAGMYYYSLVVNDEEVDTKKMILTE